MTSRAGQVKGLLCEKRQKEGNRTVTSINEEPRQEFFTHKKSTSRHTVTSVSPLTFSGDFSELIASDNMNQKLTISFEMDNTTFVHDDLQQSEESFKLPKIWKEKNGDSRKIPCSIETDPFYLEMTESMRTLKQPLKNRYLTKEFSDKDLYQQEFDSSQNEDIVSLINAVSETDKEIEEKLSIWREIKSGSSTSVQNETYEVTSREQNLFSSLRKLEDNKVSSITQSSPAARKIVKLRSEPCKQTTSDKNFIVRNIEFAKEGNMAQFSLTDEEKAKLESILAEPDTSEEHCSGDYVISEPPFSDAPEDLSDSDDSNTEKKCGLIDKKHVNHFKLSDLDSQRMTELEAKIEEILGSFPEKFKYDAESRDYEDPLENADKSGRLWKFADLDERIKNIDKELKALVAKEAEETEKRMNAISAENEAEQK